jgi:hypothetical protein
MKVWKENPRDRTRVGILLHERKKIEKKWRNAEKIKIDGEPWFRDGVK